MKKNIRPKIVPVPVDLLRLLFANPEDFKDPTMYDEVQQATKGMLKILYELHK